MAISVIPRQVTPLRKWAFHATAAMRVLFILLTWAAVSAAADYHVSNTDDSGAGSLRQAIHDANDGDTIVIDGSVGTDAFNILSLLDPLAAITFQNASGTSLHFDAGSAGGDPRTDYTLKAQNDAILSGTLPGTVSHITTGSYASVVCTEGSLAFANDMDGKISGSFGSSGTGVLAMNDITLQNGLSGAVEVTTTDNSAYGLRSVSENVTITGELSGSVRATAGTNAAYGFYINNNIAISGALSGTVSSEAGTATAYGLRAQEGEISLSNDLSGTVTARTGTHSAYGLSAYNDLKIGGNLSGTVSATAGTSGAYALRSYDNLAVSGDLSGSVTAESGTHTAYGLKAGDALTITGDLAGSVSATAGTYDAFGLYSGDNKAMMLGAGLSGSVAAKAGDERAIGIYSLGTLNNGAGGAASISGSVTAEAAGLAVAIGVEDGMNVHVTGTVTATDTTGSGKAYAIVSGRADIDSWRVNSADNIDDTVTLGNGANVTGRIDLGSGTGTDTLTLDGGGTLNGAVSNITEMTKNGAGTWITAGNIGTTNLSVNAGALCVSGQIDADTVSINAGTLSVEAENQTGAAYGLNTSNLSSSVAMTEDIAATASGHSAYGIHADQSISISGALSGAVSANTGSSGAYGLHSGENLTITGDVSGNITATAGADTAVGLSSGKDMVLGSGISGAISAKAGASNALAVYSLGALNDGAGGPVTVSGSVTAEAAGLAVGIGVEDGMNVRVTGSVTATDTSGSGKAYAIASGRAGDDLWRVNSADTIDDTVILESGASITGQIDLGSGSGTDTLTLKGGGTLNGAVSNITHMTKNGAGTWTTSGNIGTRNLTINEGALSVSGQIDADTVSINAGTLSVEAENQTGAAFGLNTSNLSSSVSMAEDITATSSGHSAYGIHADQNISISGALSGAVSASTGSSGAYGLHSGENLTITGDLSGSVSATAGTDTAVGLFSDKDMVLGSGISGAISAKAGASNALAVYSLGALNDGAGGAVTVSGSVTAEAAGLAVGIGVEDGMNVRVTGSVTAKDTTGSGNAYAIASGRAGDGFWSVNSTGNIDDTVTLVSGASITGQIDLGGGSGTDTLTLEGGGTLNGAVSNITDMTKNGAGTWTTSGKIETKNLSIHAGTLSMDAETGHVVDGNLDIKAGTTVNAAVRQKEATIAVTGTATINGTVNFQMETFVPSGPGLVVISSGTLADAGAYTVDNPFMAAAANGNNIVITKEAYADRSLSTFNSRALAEMLDDASLDASGDMADLLTKLDDIDTLGEFHSCLEELETNPAFSAMGMDTARLFTSAVQTRMAEVRTRQAVIAQTCQMDPEDPFTWPLLASTGDVSPLISPRPPQKPNAFFIQALGRDGRLDSHDGYDGYDYDTTGFFVGWDRLQGPSFLAGASLGYAQTDVDYLDTGKSRSDVENYSAGFYGTWFGSNWYLDATLWAVYNTFDTNRNITFLDDTAESDSEGCTLSGKLDYGYRFSVASMGLTPLVSCEYAWFRQNDYSETGAGAANLNVDSLTNDSLKSGIGFNLDRPIHLKDMVIVPEVSGRWMHEFLSRERQYNVTMSGSPGIVFPQTLAQAEEDSFRFGAGLTAVLTSGVSLAITYQGEQEKHAESQTLFGELRWPF